MTGWSERRRAATVTAGAGSAFVVLALMPRRPVPDGTPTPVEASTVLSPKQLERAETYAVSLVV